MKDLMSVYDAMKNDYIQALGKKRDMMKKKPSDSREKNLAKLEESLGVILMGRKALLGDLQESVKELENAIDWHHDHNPDHEDLKKAEARLELAQQGPLAEDDHFGVDEQTLETMDYADMSSAPQFPGMSQLDSVPASGTMSSGQPGSRLSKSAGQKRSSYMADAKSNWREQMEEKSAVLAEAKAASAKEAAEIAAFKLDLAMKAEKIAMQKQLSFEKALARQPTKRTSEKEQEEEAAMLADVKQKSAKEAASVALKRRKSFENAAANADRKQKSAVKAFKSLERRQSQIQEEETRAMQEDAEVDEKPEQEEEDYEKKENELDDINGALGIKEGKKIDYEKIDLNVRTIVHGFEDKVLSYSLFCISWYFLRFLC